MDTPLSQPTTPPAAPVAAPAAPKLSVFDKILMALGGLGALFMLYLTKLHFMPTDSALCNFGEGLSCEVVNQSLYSEVLGVPLSLLGLAYFVTVVVLAWRKPVPQSYRAIQLFTVFSLVFGISLTYIELYHIGSICVFCEGSKLLMVGILAAATVREKRANGRMPATWWVAAAVVGVAFSAVSRYLSENYY